MALVRLGVFAMLLEFPHRASAVSRAANSINKSAVTPASRVVLVASTADHHSAGMLSRLRHFETVEYVAPMSHTAASTEGHKSITALNEVGFAIATCLGQSGLKSKANVADDEDKILVKNPGMADRMSETEEKLAFIRRVRLARMARFDTQKPICTILGIEQDVYKHYEKRSVLPHRFIPKFIAATGVDYDWLLAGEGKGPAVENIPKHVPRRGRAPKARAA